MSFPNRTNQPHIVKFSGGRSSGMMLMNLLREEKLDPKRGDVVVFNNTSAEHPATYEFVRKIKTISEEKYNIPFFWLEFQTYEDANNSAYWVRKPSYKLVNEHPYSKKNKNGYRYKGEVFEEMISHSGYLPNQYSRSCTLSMKIFITNSFLLDWLAQKSGIERLGHHGEATRITDQDVIDVHTKNGGTTPQQILLAKKAFVRSCNFVRNAQEWVDFTNATICFDNQELKKSVIGGKAQLYGDLAIDYVSCLGIRSDEKRRLIKINSRMSEEDNKKNTVSLDKQPHGESILAPLVDNNVSREQVIDFWKKQDFNLKLSDTGIFSNCVYCPLKGKIKLTEIATKELSDNKVDRTTPASIEWWIRMEKKYSRDLSAEKREAKKGVSYIGFFGSARALAFGNIKEKAQQKEKTVDPTDKEIFELESSRPCHCMD